MVYEEEDFQSMQYGYHLSPDISEQRVVGMLREIEEDLNKKSKLHENTELVAGLFGRIKFVRVLYQALLMLLQRKEDQQAIIADSQRLLQAALDMLFVMKRTVELGSQAHRDRKSFIFFCALPNYIKFAVEHLQMLGFEPLVNQRLLPPTFPRYTKIKPRKEALIYFENMVERFKIVTKIQTITSLHQALVSN